MKENSIEKDIEIVENLLSNAHVDYEEYYKQIEIGDISFNAIKNLLSNYKKVLKENEELKANCIPIQKVKEKIRKNEEIIDISNDGDLIHELFQENKVYEELLESEE